MSETGESFFYMTILIVLYFIPIIVANKRKHANQWPIFLTNLFFGWTGIGWLVTLIWATTNNTRKE